MVFMALKWGGRERKGKREKESEKKSLRFKLSMQKITE